MTVPVGVIGEVTVAVKVTLTPAVADVDRLDAIVVEVSPRNVAVTDWLVPGMVKRHEPDEGKERQPVMPGFALQPTKTAPSRVVRASIAIRSPDPTTSLQVVKQVLFVPLLASMIVTVP